MPNTQVTVTVILTLEAPAPNLVTYCIRVCVYAHIHIYNARVLPLTRQARRSHNLASHLDDLMSLESIESQPHKRLGGKRMVMEEEGASEGEESFSVRDRAPDTLGHPAPTLS